MREFTVILLATAYHTLMLPAQADIYEDPPEVCLSPDVEFATFSPKAPDDGLVYPRGSEITFTCDERYQLQGHPLVKCLPSGKWEPLPFCAKVSASGGCVRPKDPYLRAMGDLVKKARYKSNEHVRFRCDHGYFLRGSSRAKCLGKNKWDRTLPKCSKIPPFCKYPVELKMGSFQPFQKQYGVGQKVTWKCNTNHALRGAKVSTCTRQGVFRPPKPSCQPIKSNLLNRRPGGFHLKKLACFMPLLQPGLEVHPRRKSHAVGKEIRYSCKRGFRLLGSERSVCTRQGFTSETPTCKRVECEYPAVPQNGRLLGDHKGVHYYGEKLEYVCDKNFLMVGSDHTTCQDDGRFSPDPPRCNPPSCRYECDYQEGRYCQCDIGCRYVKNCCTDFEQYCRKLYY